MTKIGAKTREVRKSFIALSAPHASSMRNIDRGVYKECHEDSSSHLLQPNTCFFLEFLQYLLPIFYQTIFMIKRADGLVKLLSHLSFATVFINPPFSAFDSDFFKDNPHCLAPPPICSLRCKRSRFSCASRLFIVDICIAAISTDCLGRAISLCNGISFHLSRIRCRKHAGESVAALHHQL